MVRIRVARRAAKSLARIGAQRRAAAENALIAFVNNPMHPGLNFEKLQGYTDLYSIRASRGDRLLLRKAVDSDGDYFEVLDVGSHAIYRSTR